MAASVGSGKSVKPLPPEVGKQSEQWAKPTYSTKRTYFNCYLFYLHS